MPSNSFSPKKLGIHKKSKAVELYAANGTPPENACVSQLETNELYYIETFMEYRENHLHEKVLFKLLWRRAFASLGAGYISHCLTQIERSLPDSCIDEFDKSRQTILLSAEKLGSLLSEEAITPALTFQTRCDIAEKYLSNVLLDNAKTRAIHPLLIEFLFAVHGLITQHNYTGFKRLFITGIYHPEVEKVLRNIWQDVLLAFGKQLQKESISLTPIARAEVDAIEGAEALIYEKHFKLKKKPH